MKSRYRGLVRILAFEVYALSLFGALLPIACAAPLFEEHTDGACGLWCLLLLLDHQFDVASVEPGFCFVSWCSC